MEHFSNRLEILSGELLKVDIYTSSTVRGWYAYLCVYILLDEPVRNCFQIGEHKQSIIYEGEGFLCKSCGRLGHIQWVCTLSTPAINNITSPASLSTPKSIQIEEWLIVDFNKKKILKIIQVKEPSHRTCTSSPLKGTEALSQPRSIGKKVFF